MDTLTPSQEQYLKAIFALSSTAGFTRICDGSNHSYAKREKSGVFDHEQTFDCATLSY